MARFHPFLRSVCMGSLIGLALCGSAWSATPAISVGDASITEGDVGTNTLNIPITRSGDTTEGISVEYQTDVNPSTPATAGTDYVSIPSGTQVLLPVGTTSLNLPVTINGDLIPETSEKFFLHVTSAVNVGPTPNFANTNIGTSGRPQSVAVGDFNLDGKLDFVVPRIDDDDVAVLINTTTTGGATPTFAGADLHTVDDSPLFVTAGDFNGDGKPDLAVVNGGSSVSVLINTTAPGASTTSFDTLTDFAVGNGAFGVAVADLNGDGKQDLAVTNTFDDTVSVLLNTTAPGATTATFAAESHFSTASSPRFVAIGDVNGDGKPDLAVADFSGSVSVLLNTTAPGASPATFAAATNLTTGNGAFSVALGDVNGDGRPDLAVADFSDNNVSVLLNTTAAGASTASFATKRDFGAGTNPTSVALSDVNRDGKPDLLVSDNGNGVSVLFSITVPGATTPSFAAASSFSTGTTSVAVATGDFNGDGWTDLAVANLNSSTVSVLLNTTTPPASPASFAAKQSFSTDTCPVSLVWGDINGDGKPDLVTTNGGDDPCNGITPNTVSVLINSTAAGAGTFSFSAQQHFAAGSSPFSVAEGDVNGDGRPDLVVSNQLGDKVSVLLNTAAAGAAPGFSAPVGFALNSSDNDGRPDIVVLGDVNGDGLLDIAVTPIEQSSVQVLLNTTTPGATTPSFASPVGFATGQPPLDPNPSSTDPFAVAMGDLNNDGLLDLVVTNQGNISSPGNVSVLLNTTTPGAATPSFATKQNFLVGKSPGRSKLSDINGDGRLDLVVPNENDNTISVLLNTTSPGSTTETFSSAVTFSTGMGPAFVATGDVNGDGRPDIAVSNRTSGTVSVLMNSTAPGATTPNFAAQQSFPVGASPIDVELGDLNGDGKADLAVTNSGSAGKTVSTLLNKFYSVTLADNEAVGTIVDNDDTTPVAFKFTDRTNVGLSKVIISNAVVISGLVNQSPISVTGGSYSVGCNGSFTTVPGFISNGQRVCVLHTSAAVPSGTVNTVLTIGGASGAVSDTFSSTTVAIQDTTPNAFHFTNQTNVAFDALITSNAVAISGINDATPISVSGTSGTNYTYSIGCNGNFTSSSGVIFNGQKVCVRHTSPGTGSPLSTTITILTIGVVQGFFKSTTAAALDTTPNAFHFVDKTNVSPNSVVVSAPVVITGINTAVPVNFSGSGEISVGCNGSFSTSPPNIVNNQSICVRQTAAGPGAQKIDTIVTIGGVTDTFSTTTAAASDSTPNAFHFVSQINVKPSTPVVSNVVTISGINVGATMQVLFGGEYSIGCNGVFTASQGTIFNGQKVCVRNTSSNSNSTSTNMTLNVGGVQGVFTITTAAAPPVPDATPNAFHFMDLVNVPLGATLVSNAVTVSGINVGVVPISVAGGEYSIGCNGVFTTASGSIFNGQTVCVRHTSSSLPGTWADTTLTIGGVSDTFSSVTSTAPPNTP